MWSQVSTSNSIFEATIIEIYFCKLVDNFFFFFFFSSYSKGSRELWEAVWSRFLELWGPIAVHTNPYFLYIERFLKLKEPQNEQFEVFLVGLYGLVRISKPWLVNSFYKI